MKLNDLSGALGDSNLSDEEMEANYRQRTKLIAEERRRYNQELLSAAKPREELIIPLNCYVSSATEIYREVHFYTRSELIVGGSTPSYNGGQQASLELMVDCPGHPELKTIFFSGNPAIKTDDWITAYVFMGEAKYLQDENSVPDLSRSRFLDTELPLYVLRAVRERERALRIERVRGNKILKTYLDSSFRFP